MTPAPAVILFDGVCNFCDASVRFVIDRDPAGRFRFAAIQSVAGQRLLAEHGLPADVRTVVLIDGGRVYVRSTAALRIAARLGLPWSVARVLLVVPAPLRDLAYGLVARVRYRIFGRADVCRVPGRDMAGRFIV